MGETDNHQDFKDDVDSKKRPHAAEPTADEAKRPRNEDPVQRQRGQRMFGVLLGTLSKFKETSTKKTEAELRREQLEQRLAEKLRKEHEKLEEEVTREKERNRMRMLAQKEEEAKIRNAYTADIINNQKLNLSRFLQTKTQPPVFFLPAKHNDATQALLDQAWKNYIAQTETEGDDMDTAPFSLSAGDGVRLDAELGGDDELEDVVGEAF